VQCKTDCGLSADPTERAYTTPQNLYLDLRKRSGGKKQGKERNGRKKTVKG